MRKIAISLFAAALAGLAPAADASLNGTLYAVVAPVYDGSSGPTSFLRLFGGVQGTSSTFVIRIVSTTSGATLGTAIIPVPKNASPQFSFSALLAKANIAAPSEHGLALYIQNPETTSGYQHVTFTQASTLFENVSNCLYPLDQTVKAYYPSRVATNIHTTMLVNNTYPAQIELHNYWNAQVSYGVYVYDAGTADASGVIRAGSGALVGSKIYPVTANASKSLSMAQLQSDIGWTPAANQLHANIIVTDTGNQDPTDVVSVAIVNQTLQGAVDMSQTCAVNPPPATQSSGGGGAYLN